MTDILPEKWGTMNEIYNSGVIVKEEVKKDGAVLSVALPLLVSML